MNQQRWGHDGYQDGYRDGYQDRRQAPPSRRNQAGNFSPDAKETPVTGDVYDTAKCISSAGTHQSSDRPIRNPMDKRKDETVETATTPARQRPRSKPKRPDVAIYVPRGRRQQEHTNTQACPSEHGESTQEKPAKKSAEKSGRHTGALSMPRLRRPQREKIGNQESAAVSSIRTDVPPEGDTSHGTLVVTGEDSLGDAVKHKAKRKKGSSRTLDEKTGQDAVKKDGKKKRKDGLELVAPPGDMNTKGSSESEIRSLHSHDDSVSISPEYADTSLLVESGHISCGTSIEDRVKSQDALQSVDIDQLQVSATRCDGNAETMSTEPSGQSNSAEKDDDKSHQPPVDADQLPGNQETDGSHALTGSHVEAAIPAVELVECTDVPRSCNDQMESQLNDKSCLTDEDVCRNVDLQTLGEAAASENEGKVSCGECVAVEDVMVEQCVTKRSDNDAKEVGLGAKLDTEPETQQPYGGDSNSQNVHTTMESKNVVDATSELKLSVCSEKPLTTDSLTGAISGSGCGCGAPCRCGTSENSATGDALVTRDHECCTGDGEAGNGEGRCISEESEQLEDGLNCEHENKLNESDNETHSTNELAGNKVNEQAATEICKSKCERSVCDDNESESNVDMQDDIDVLGETESNVHSGNNVSEDESVTYNIESGNENESCQLKPSSDDTGRVQSKPDVASKKTKKRVKVENVKTASSDIGKLPDSACVSHQGDSVAMEAEDEDEDDSWDKLFDDTGEALDPKLVEELTVAVGKVKVQKPKFDYFSFQPKELEMDDDEYSHLVEIYDFPSDLSTKDLLAAFREYKDKGFDVKWVDDSHAIGIFSSPISARGALTISSPFMKVRPISQATRATKVKAQHCTEFLQPYKERPETNASVARNLVAGALGLATRVPKEQREAERRKLREARAKKKQAKQQVVDVWEGRVGGCAMDEV